MASHWPSLLLTLAILIGVGVCFRRFDKLSINEVKALISVIFGFATSFLLLSFIWLIQKKPLNSTWPMQNINLIDSPNMFPDGSSSDIAYSRRRRSTVYSISLDQPPKYEDALNYSKPINWFNNESEKSGIVCLNLPSTIKTQDFCSIKLCDKHSNELSNVLSHIISLTKDCLICNNATNMIVSLNKDQSCNISKLSKYITRESTSTSGPSQMMQYLRFTSQSSANQGTSSYRRKSSIQQLDASRLLESPPKYHELRFNDNQPTSNNKYNA